MKSKYVVGLIAFFILILPFVLAVKPVLEEDLVVGEDYLPGSLAITIEKNSFESLEALDSALRSADTTRSVQKVEYFFEEPSKMNALAKEYGLDRVFLVEVDPDANHLELVEKFSKIRGVKSVELNMKMELFLEPNDPFFVNGEQWALDSDADYDITAVEAWDLEIGDPEVVIAVLDTGIDLIHLDLVDKIVPGYDFVDDDDDPMDLTGHGTKVGGMAGAKTNNGEGVASLCQECMIMPLRVCANDDQCSSSAIKQALYYAASNGADVISMSFGHYYYDQSVSYCFGGSSYDAVLDYAYDAGVVLVAAVGNENFDDYAYPACYDKVIGVANLDVDGDKSDMSNFGDWVDVAAPGVGIMTTKLDDTYGTASGTSMSAPFVAGLAGLMLSSHVDLSPALVRDIIMQTSEDKSYWQSLPIAAGRINAYNAISVCVVDETTFIENNVCVTDDKPNKCFEQEIIKDCNTCGCPRAYGRRRYECQPDGSCLLIGKKMKATAMALP